MSLPSRFSFQISQPIATLIVVAKSTVFYAAPMLALGYLIRSKVNPTIGRIRNSVKVSRRKKKGSLCDD